MWLRALVIVIGTLGCWICGVRIAFSWCVELMRTLCFVVVVAFGCGFNVSFGCGLLVCFDCEYCGWCDALFDLCVVVMCVV